MKSIYFSVLMAISVMLAAHPALAKQNNIYKAVAAIQRSGKAGIAAPGAKKNGSSISGTGIKNGSGINGTGINESRPFTRR
ncbi:MAG: hypothetical protein WA666_11595 [Nitrospirota bacterium]